MATQIDNSPSGDAADDWGTSDGNLLTTKNEPAYIKDKELYRRALNVLGFVAIACVSTVIALAFCAPDREIPDAVLTFGGTAIGVLVMLFRGNS